MEQVHSGTCELNELLNMQHDFEMMQYDFEMVPQFWMAVYFMERRQSYYCPCAGETALKGMGKWTRRIHKAR